MILTYIAPMPIVTVALIVLNTVVYLLQLDGRIDYTTYGMIPAGVAKAPQIEPFISNCFLHDPTTVSHLAGNMLFLAAFGAVVEHEIGGARLAALYLSAGFFGSLLHATIDPTSTTALIGASGAIFGVLAVAGSFNKRLLIFAAVFAGVNIYRAFFGGEEGVSFGAHIGGFAAGVLFAALLRITGTQEAT